MEAVRSLQSTNALHLLRPRARPRCSILTGTGKIGDFVPSDGMPSRCRNSAAGIRFPAGQPRDGNLAACYATFETATSTTYFACLRHESAGAKIRGRFAAASGPATRTGVTRSSPPPLERRPAPRSRPVIDGFHLEEHLHQGGMAPCGVTRVDAAPGEAAAPLIMKVPRIRGGDPATIVGFEVEQMIMPTLSGVHVPKFVAKGDFTRQPYIVMEHPRHLAARARSTPRRCRWTR